jgi:hypothetical protein
MKFRWIGVVLLAAASVGSAQDGPVPGAVAPRAQTFIRGTARLNGVFSPRGFFNITVRLYKLHGLERARFSLKKSQMVLDFAPGVEVKPEDITQVMVSAGYKPGKFAIQHLPLSAAEEDGPGWMKIRHPKARSALVRWLEINF